MTEAYIQVNPDNASGKKVRTTELLVGANTVEQQVQELADEAGNKLAQPFGTVVDQDTQGAPIVQGLVGDTPPTGYLDGEVRPVSMTNDGRLRVSTVAARIGVSWTDPDDAKSWGEGPSFKPDSPLGDW